MLSGCIIHKNINEHTCVQPASTHRICPFTFQEEHLSPPIQDTSIHNIKHFQKKFEGRYQWKGRHYLSYSSGLPKGLLCWEWLFKGNAPNPVVSPKGLGAAVPPLNIWCWGRADTGWANGVGCAKGFGGIIIAACCWPIAAIWTAGGAAIWLETAKGSGVMNGLGGPKYCCCCCL